MHAAKMFSRVSALPCAIPHTLPRSLVGQAVCSKADFRLNSSVGVQYNNTVQRSKTLTIEWRND